jgi:hypothetical protein
MRSALIAVSWAQAVLIAKSREGKAQAGVLRVADPVLDPGVGAVAGLQERQLPDRRVGRYDLVAPPVGLFEQGQLRAGVGSFPPHDQAHPGRPTRQVQQFGDLGDVPGR